MSGLSVKQNAESALGPDGESLDQEAHPERSFVSAVAAQLARTAAELDAKASLIAASVREDGQVRRDLLGPLQSFDRLEQELSAIAELLLRYAALPQRRSVEDIDNRVLSGVRLGDLKTRIALAWRGETETIGVQESDDELF